MLSAALLGAAVLLARAADPAEPLAAQARYWEERGRPDLAREAWEKLLRSSPDSAEALAGLATVEARSGNAAAAAKYLEQLKRAAPGSPQIGAVEQAVKMGSLDTSRLARPRELARDGKFDSAVAAYREAFGNEIPGGRLGLEYYQTLAGTKNGWEEARRGIEKLAQDNPGDAVFQLAAAQHLTYREETRRAGIRALMGLQASGATATQAKQAWRQALVWLGAEKGDEPLYRGYIEKFGQDAQVAQKLAALEGVGKGGVVVTTEAGTLQAYPGELPGVAGLEDGKSLDLRRAYGALDQGRLDEAERRFQALLQVTPGDADSLAGLGIVRLRQQNYAQARDYLQQASERDPARAKRWQEALNAARFWEQVRLAETARRDGKLQEAEARYRNAIRLDPARATREVSVRLSLADVLVEAGRDSEAERIYRDVLTRDDDSAGATRGLMGIYTRSGRVKEALALAEKLGPAARADLGSIGSLQAQQLRAQAEAAIKRKDDRQAEELLRQALLLDAESPWTRLDLARLYQRQGREHEAATLVDALVTGPDTPPEALHMKALLLAEQQQWFDALGLLERIPKASRTRDMTQLQRRLWVRYQAQRASLLARRGMRVEAAALAAQLEPFAADSGELSGAVAQAWADLGDEERAVRQMRKALARSPNPDPGLRLQYAALLFSLGQDAEFEILLDDLLDQDGWARQQEQDLANLQMAYRLRQADRLRQQGDLARAWDSLEPLLRVHPDDARLLMALAQLHADAKDFDRARGLFARVLAADPRNLDAYKGAIGAALASQDLDEADRLLDRAFGIDPKNARLYSLAGKVARARGQDGRALQLYREALRLDAQQPGTGEEFGERRYAPKLYLLQPASYAVIPAKAGIQGAKHGAARPVDPRLRGDDRKGDYALVTMPRWWRPSNLIKVSTPPKNKQRATAPEDIPPGYPRTGRWVQNGPNSYIYVVEPGTAAVGDPRASYRVQAEAERAPVETYEAPRLKSLPPEPPLVRYRPPPLAQRLTAVEPAAPPPKPAESARSTDNELLREIGEIQAQRAPYAAIGFGMRARDGQAGLDELSDIEAPMALSFAAGGSGRFTLRAVPVSLDAGTLQGRELPFFGTLALVGDSTLRFSEDAAGVAVAGQYQIGGFSIDVGSSPIGFPVESIVGGLRWSMTTGRASFKVDLSRRSLPDSLLSYAGARDPGLGRDWGGITKNGGRVDFAWDLGRSGFYLDASYHVLDGKDVEQNRVFEAGGGIYARALERRDMRVTYGLNVTTFFYDENLRRFSYGHGGYFSPQSYFSLALPVDWEGGSQRLSYRVGGAIGVQSFREDGQVWFPNDSGLQLALEELAAASATTVETRYQGQTQTGLGFNVSAQLEYLLAPEMAIGGRIALDNARDYDEASALGYLRYLFGPQRSLKHPPSLLVPYWNFGDPRL